MAYRVDYLCVATGSSVRLQAIFKVLEDKIEDLTNLTFLLTTMLQVMERASPTQALLIKCIDSIMLKSELIDHHNIHFVCGFLEAIGVTKNEVWSVVLKRFGEFVEKV